MVGTKPEFLLLCSSSRTNGPQSLADPEADVDMMNVPAADLSTHMPAQWTVPSGLASISLSTLHDEVQSLHPSLSPTLSQPFYPPTFGNIYAQALTLTPLDLMHSHMMGDAFPMFTTPNTQHNIWPNLQVVSSTWTATQTETHGIAAQALQVPARTTGTCETPPTNKKIQIIIGDASLFFHSNAGNYVRIGTMLSYDLQTIIDGEYRGYFSGFGTKATYVIVMHNKLPYKSKQKYCLQTIRGEQVHYTRIRLAQEASNVVEGFLRENPDFHTDPAFQAWPAGSNIDNFALVELRKISRASIQIILEYLPAANI